MTKPQRLLNAVKNPTAHRGYEKLCLSVKTAALSEPRNSRSDPNRARRHDQIRRAAQPYPATDAVTGAPKLNRPAPIPHRN